MNYLPDYEYFDLPHVRVIGAILDDAGKTFLVPRVRQMNLPADWLLRPGFVDPPENWPLEE